MRLYIVHCGFYDEQLADGVYEFHINIPVAAEDVEEAKREVRQHSTFRLKKMHIDGIQEIETVSGRRVQLSEPEGHATQVTHHLHRDL